MNMNVGSRGNDVTADVTPYANIIPGFGTVAPKLNVEFNCRLGGKNERVWSKAKVPSSKTRVEACKKKKNSQLTFKKPG